MTQNVGRKGKKRVSSLILGGDAASDPTRRDLVERWQVSRAARLGDSADGRPNVKTDFVTVFAVSLIVYVIVTLLWNLIVHGASTIDWETSFRFAILFGIILPWIKTR